MLDLLVAYAKDKGLVADPGFKPKTVRWGIEVTPEGQFTGIIPFDKPGREYPRCPDLTQPQLKFLGRGGGYGAHFLASECSVIALLTDGEAKLEEATLKRHTFFMDLLTKAAVDAPLLDAAHRVLAKEETREAIRAQLAANGAKSTDKATFFINSKALVDGTDWHPWWRTYLSDLDARMNQDASRAAVAPMVCLATGTVASPARLHPKISGLGDVGGQPQVPFIGFDKEAFCSFGLSQSANGAVSEEAAYAYRAALDDLLKRSVRIAGMKVAYWFDREAAEKDNPFADLFEGASEQRLAEVEERSMLERARQRVKRLRTGEASKDLADARFFALSLSGAGGRAMVRDWMTGQFEELAAATEQWFDDLSLIGFSGKLTRDPSFYAVLTAILDPKGPNQQESDWIKPVGSLRIPLWKAALNKNYPVPFAAIGLMLPNHRDFILTGKLEAALPRQKATSSGRKSEKAKEDGTTATNNTDPFALSLLYRRMSLIKAYHNRQYRITKEGHPLNSSLTEDYPEPAYHCGRLMAVLADLQRAALPEVDAGVVQRYYGAASATPFLVLGRLERLSKHHLNKLPDQEQNIFHNRLKAVWNSLERVLSARGMKELPATLTLEEQSLFALGYYHQIAYRKTSKDQNGADTPTEAENVSAIGK